MCVPLERPQGILVCNEPMASHTHNSAVELNRILAGGRISEEALQVMTGIPIDRLRAALAAAALAPAALMSTSTTLSGEETTRLSILAGQLTDGMTIDDDDRLKAILESLTVECRLTPANLALLTGIDVDDLELALNDPHALSADKKYTLAIRSSYLINAVNQARP